MGTPANHAECRGMLYSFLVCAGVTHLEFSIPPKRVQSPIIPKSPPAQTVFQFPSDSVWLCVCVCLCVLSVWLSIRTRSQLTSVERVAVMLSAMSVKMWTITVK